MKFSENLDIEMALKKDSIIVVDDETNILKMVKTVLKSKYDIHTFNSGEEMLSSISTIRPSLFILDLIMPELSGIELTKKIRRNKVFDLVPIVIYSGIEPTGKNISETVKAGSTVFVPKTSEIGFFISVVDNMIAWKHKNELFFKKREAVLSMMRNDLINNLTGVVSSLELLKLSETRISENIPETKIIVNCSEQIRHITEDVILILSDPVSLKTKYKCDYCTVDTIVNKVRNFNKFSEIKIFFDILCYEGELYCNSKLIARTIIYLIRFIDVILDSTSEIEYYRPEQTLSIKKEETYYKISLIVDGNFASILKKKYENTLNLCECTKRAIVPVIYSEIVFLIHNSSFLIEDIGESCFVSFSIPNSIN